MQMFSSRLVNCKSWLFTNHSLMVYVIEVFSYFSFRRLSLYVRHCTESFIFWNAYFVFKIVPKTPGSRERGQHIFFGVNDWLRNRRVFFYHESRSAERNITRKHNRLVPRLLFFRSPYGNRRKATAIKRYSAYDNEISSAN